MAGAIIGACSTVQCSAPVQDRRYIEAEASRLAEAANREHTSSFRYPDLLSWKPARAAIDAVADADGHLVLDGIARLNPKLGAAGSDGGGEMLQWFELEFGEQILARVQGKHHEAPRDPARYAVIRTISRSGSCGRAQDAGPLLRESGTEAPRKRNWHSKSGRQRHDEVLKEVIEFLASEH